MDLLSWVFILMVHLGALGSQHPYKERNEELARGKSQGLWREVPCSSRSALPCIFHCPEISLMATPSCKEAKKYGLYFPSGLF